MCAHFIDIQPVLDKKFDHRNIALINSILSKTLVYKSSQQRSELACKSDQPLGFRS